MIGLADLTPAPRCGASSKPSGSTIGFEATHTMSDEQVEWFEAGSALKTIRRKPAR
jgi:hypothetical protein